MSDNRPLVSIIVPAYNSAAYLPELCESIRGQSYPHFEALFLDDGSNDGTWEVLQTYVADQRFRVVRWQSNRGVNAATSALLGAMKGEFWCNPGADDVLAADFVSRRLAVLQSHPEAAMVHGPAETIDESGNLVADFEQLTLPSQVPASRALRMLLQHNFINTPSLMIRSDISRLVLPFFLRNWKYAQDWYLWILHAACGFDVLWDSERLHKYRIHSQSLSRTPSHEAVRRAEIRLVPLCALSAAAQFSNLAAEFWSDWRKSLYSLWLLRAARLRSRGLLTDEWVQLGARAFYGPNIKKVDIVSEIGLRIFSVVDNAMRERHFISQQSFRVSGLAQIDDPVFR